MSRQRILLLSTADWHATLWTNKQYMACELAAESHVTYVESLGLRRPQLSMHDARRIAARLPINRTKRPIASSSAATPRQQPEHLDVRSPLVLPLHRGPARVVNRAVLHRVASGWRGSGAGRVLWTYTPTTYGLESGAPTVYHCVDLMANYPGIDPRVIERGERHLARAGAVAIGSSREVSRHLERVGFHTVIEWPNVADVEPFLAASELTRTAARDPKLVVFGGNISPYKVDCELVLALARRRPDARIVLAGPVALGGGRGRLSLDELEAGGVELVGTKSIGELAALYASASVAIIPYLINEYTRGVLPLKVHEYLAAGLPVVSSALPSLDAVGNDVVIARDPLEFADAVSQRLGAWCDSDGERRRAFAREHSWTRRGAQARALVHDLASRAARG